jgi:Mg2+ and Co2+ transporter CorA
MSLINFSFIKLMNSYIEQHKLPVSAGSITMQLFDLTVAYEIDYLKLLEKGDDFQKALNHARQEKINEVKELKDKVTSVY